MTAICQHLLWRDNNDVLQNIVNNAETVFCLAMHYARKVTEIPAPQFSDVLCTPKPKHIENNELELEHKTGMAISFK